MTDSTARHKRRRDISGAGTFFRCPAVCQPDPAVVVDGGVDMSARNAATAIDLSSDSDTSSGGRMCWPSPWDPQYVEKAEVRRKKAKISDPDRLIAEELNSLSLESRTRNFEEIHGVATLIEETEESIQRDLELLDEKLDKLRKRGAYDTALFLSPKFVKDPKFRLSFLRSEEFNIDKAAIRMINYFRAKHLLFGDDALVRTLTMKDLDDIDKEYMRLGAVQITPDMRDRRGRYVYTSYGKYNDYKSIESSTRVAWYLIEKIIQNNDEAQRHGLVVIMDIIDDKHVYNPLFGKSSTLSKCMRIRHVGVHLCYDQPAYSPVISLLRLAISQESRLRMRIHFGSRTECYYDLQTYAIATDVIPISQVDGTPKTAEFLEYLECLKEEEARAQSEMEERRRKQQQSIHPICIDRPDPKDIVLGKGRPSHNFSGNVRLSEIIDATYLDMYEQCRHGDKGAICDEIVQHVHGWGGRFLKRCENELDGWLVVTNEEARGKVSHTIRSKFKAQGKLRRPTFTVGVSASSSGVGGRDANAAGSRNRGRVRVSNT
mmetsp:Transcript_20681/g.58899  ORF Transcript_20681/g.58899 Transcript_20681/m.58899 type:complete len:545 (+) Transcript_20681:480-2114(+)